MEEMDAVKILKEETKLTLSDLHDFAKWKLTAAAALAAIGLGLTKEHSQTGGWLLVFIPYACLFVDLNCYQYLLRVLLIAKVIKESCKADNLLRRYECLCEEACKRGVFKSGIFAQLGSSIIFSLLPVYVSFQTELKPFKSASSLLCWFIGFGLIVFFYMDFRKKYDTLLHTPTQTSCSA